MIGEGDALLGRSNGPLEAITIIYWFLSHYLSHESSPPTHALSSLHRHPDARVVSSSHLCPDSFLKPFSNALAIRQ